MSPSDIYAAMRFNLDTIEQIPQQPIGAPQGVYTALGTMMIVIEQLIQLAEQQQDQINQLITLIEDERRRGEP